MTVVINGTTGITNPNSMTIGNGGGSVATNTAVGTSALAANTTGDTNTAVGYQALTTNDAGGSNTALGVQALRYSTGSHNTAVGRGSLYSNTTGTYNVAVGRDALQANTTASFNTAVGYQAGYSNTTAAGSFFGYGAGYSNTTGANNSFFGINAGRSTTTGNRNTLVGTYTGYNLTTGSGNTFIGTTGASDNVGCGYYMTTGNNNVIIGGYTGNGGLDIRTSSNYIVLSDGDGNPKAFIDDQANSRLKLVGTGVNNAGVVVGLGSTLTEYGYLSLGTSYGVASSKDVALGLSTTAGARVYVQNRSAGVYLADGGTSWTSNSDERLKTELVPFENATAKVASIRTGTGRYLTDEETISRSFLIAQDVQAVLPEAVDVAKDEQGTLGVAYTDLIPLLIASIKELNAKVDAQAAEIAALKGTA